MGTGVSDVYAEDGQTWLRVSRGHAVTEDWLLEKAPDLYADWWAAPSGDARDQIALTIEQRLEELESTDGRREAADRHQQQARPRALDGRVARYEHAAQRLGTIPLADPGRPAVHRAHQVEGDALRDEVVATQSGQARKMLDRRIDAADLIADRPFIAAVAGIDVQVDRLAVVVAALDGADGRQTAAVNADAIRAEMVAENPLGALRADVLSAVSAAGHDPAELRQEIDMHGVDLARVTPTLTPASDFWARHALAIEAYLDREISAGGFRDLPSYVASWQHDRPVSASLHDTEQALVAHVVGDVIISADDAGQDLRDAHRLWERAAGRVAIREWSAASEHDELEPTVDRLAEEQQLELGLTVGEGADAAYAMDQEVG